MCKVPVTSVSRTIIIEYITDILTRAFMICGYQKKCNTFLFYIAFLFQFTEGVNKYINSLISELISSAIYNQNTILRNRVSQNGFSYTQKFFSCNLSSFLENIFSWDKRIFKSVWSYKIYFLPQKMLALF